MNVSRTGCGKAAPNGALQRVAEALASPMTFQSHRVALGIRRAGIRMELFRYNPTLQMLNAVR